MAEQLPNIYTFGQVQVDTSSLADLQAKLLAKRQAKDDALGKYFEKQMGSLSREGIADNDVADYEKSISELRDYWKTNAENIKKGGQSKVDFDNKIQGIKNFVYESKEKKKDLLEANKLRLDGKISTDDDIFVISQMEKPLSDKSRLKPDGSKYGFKDFGVFVQPFDPNKRKSFFGVVSEGIEPSVEKLVKKKKLPGGDIEETFEYSYTPKELQFMQDKAVISLGTDRIAKNYYQQLKDNPTDPSNVNTLAKLKKAWDDSGLHTGDEMDSIEDFAMADVLLEFYSRPKPTQTKTRNIPRPSGATSGPKTKLEDYFVLNKYTATEPLPDGSGRKGIRLNKINAADQKLIGKFIIPAFVGGEDWYIVKSPGEWEGDGGNFITDKDIALDQAPKEVKDAYLGGGKGGKKKINY